MMTSAEITRGVRAFLRGQGDAIDLAWFERAGKPAQEALFHMLHLPSTSRKTKMTIKSVLLAAFPSRDVEARLFAYVRENSDPRVCEIDEGGLRSLIEKRDELRTSFIRKV
jgi:hypothetical protein